jgi:hypothetical protein
MHARFFAPPLNNAGGGFETGLLTSDQRLGPFANYPGGIRFFALSANSQLETAASCKRQGAATAPDACHQGGNQERASSLPSDWMVGRFSATDRLRQNPG